MRTETINGYEWQVFDRPHRRADYPRLTVTDGGKIRLNQAAYRALGQPERVVCLVNRASRAIGLRPVPDGERPSNSYAINGRKQGVFAVEPRGLCEAADYSPDATRRFRAQLEDGVLFCLLDEPEGA